MPLSVYSSLAKRPPKIASRPRLLTRRTVGPQEAVGLSADQANGKTMPYAGSGTHPQRGIYQKLHR